MTSRRALLCCSHRRHLRSPWGGAEEYRGQRTGGRGSDRHGRAEACRARASCSARDSGFGAMASYGRTGPLPADLTKLPWSTGDAGLVLAPGFDAAQQTVAARVRRHRQRTSRSRRDPGTEMRIRLQDSSGRPVVAAEPTCLDQLGERGAQDRR